jgi:hypothetical protein
MLISGILRQIIPVGFVGVSKRLPVALYALGESVFEHDPESR